MPDDPAEIIENIQSDAEEKGRDDERWTQIDARIRAIEDRASSTPEPPSVDLSPLTSSLDAFGSRLAALEARLTEPVKAESETAAEADTDDESEDEDDEIPPQIDVQAAQTASIKRERPPGRPHLLFRRVGRGR